MLCQLTHVISKSSPTLCHSVTTTFEKPAYHIRFVSLTTHAVIIVGKNFYMVANVST